MRALSVCLVLLLLTACTTKKEAKGQAHRAFVAGQQETLRRMQMATPTDAITVQGPVVNPVLPWEPGLSLRQAILAAEYDAPQDPAEILVVRGGVAFRYEPVQVLTGREILLQPGDLLQINLQPTAQRPGLNR